MGRSPAKVHLASNRCLQAWHSVRNDIGSKRTWQIREVTCRPCRYSPAMQRAIAYYNADAREGMLVALDWLMGLDVAEMVAKGPEALVVEDFRRKALADLAARGVDVLGFVGEEIRRAKLRKVELTAEAAHLAFGEEGFMLKAVADSLWMFSEATLRHLGERDPATWRNVMGLDLTTTVKPESRKPSRSEVRVPPGPINIERFERWIAESEDAGVDPAERRLADG